MKHIHIQEPGIGLYGITGNYGGRHERNWCETWFILYDKQSYSHEYLLEHTADVYLTHEGDTPNTDLNLCFLHEVDVRSNFSAIDEHTFSQTGEDFVLNYDYFNEYGRGAHICSISRSNSSFVIHGKELTSIELHTGYFVFFEEAIQTSSLESFNDQLTLSNAELLNDWQNVLVPQEKFFEVYRKALDQFDTLNLSSPPLKHEYSKFFFLS